MGCCHAARQEKQEKRPRSTTPSSTTVRDAAVSLSLAASSRPFEECVCGSSWYSSTSFNTDTYHQTRPYCQLCGTVHPALRSPDRATRHPHTTQKPSCERNARRSSRRQAATHAAPSHARQRATRGRQQPAQQWGEKVVSPLQGLQRRAGRDDGQAGARGAGGPDR